MDCDDIMMLSVEYLFNTNQVITFFEIFGVSGTRHMVSLFLYFILFITLVL